MWQNPCSIELFGVLGNGGIGESDESDESDECVNLRKRHSFKIADQFSIVLLAVLSFGRSSFWLPSLWQGRQIWHAVVTNGGR